MKRVFYRSLCAVLCVSMLSTAIPVRVMAEEVRQQKATAEQTDSCAADVPGDSPAADINTNGSGNELSQGESDSASSNSNQSQLQASLASDMSPDSEQATRVATSGYQHSDSSTSGSVTLTVEWNDLVLGQPTTFHVSATGGSGSYLFRMDAPSYSNPNEYVYEPVADPSRGEWTKYTNACVSHDFTFTTTATGSYNFRFYLMDKASGVYYLRTNTYIQVADDAYPSVASIVNKAVSQAKQKTNGSEYEMALYLHDWLLDQLEYDNSLKWSSAESALTRGLGTCQAYESAYSKLLTAAGITNSETRDTYDGHTWNAVKLDGKWYQVDCTWDDTTDNFYGDLDQRHLYFCITDELMAIAHKGHAKIYSADGYATRSTSLKDNYFVRNGKANEWADKYAERIQQHLDDRKSEFSVDADNSTFPPSISGIQNGIVAYAMNHREWNANGAKVDLTATSNVETISSSKWSSKYNFAAEYPEAPSVPERVIDDGEYLLAPSLDPSVAVSATTAGCSLSSSAGAIAFAYDEATGCYRLTSGGMALAAAGESVALAAPDGSPSQLWRVEACGGGWSVTSRSTGLALDVYCGSAREGNRVWLYEPNGTAAQSWALRTPAGRTVDDGEYLLAPSLDPSVAVSATTAGCSLSSSAGAIAFAYDEATGCYRLTSGGMALAAAGESVALAAPDGSPSQLWRVEACGGGWSVTSRSTGLALDVYCGSAREGNRVWLYEPNGTAAQSWALRTP